MKAESVPPRISANLLRRIIPIIGVLGASTLTAAPQMESIDLKYAPPGETVTLSGSDLAEIQTVRLLFGPFEESAPANQADASSVQFTMPDVRRKSREYLIMVTGPGGSTISLPGMIAEHTTVGEAAGEPSEILVVRSGGVLQGFVDARYIFVEAGGVYEIGSELFAEIIIAEDGSVVDLTGAGEMIDTRLFYSPGAEIIGSMPTNIHGESMGEEVPSITASYGDIFLGQGLPLNLTIEGAGQVLRQPSLPYYPYYSYVQLTAEAPAGVEFSGWSGDVNSSLSTIEVNISSHAPTLTATFSEGFVLKIFDIPGVEISVSPEQPAYGAGQEVTLTAYPLPGYIFAGWEMDAGGEGLSTVVVMDGNKTVMPVVRPESYEAIPQLTSVDHYALPENAVITFAGTSLDDVSEVNFAWLAGHFYPAPIETGAAGSTMQVRLPDFDQETREYSVVMSGATGSTVGISGSFSEYTDPTTDPLAPGMPEPERTLVIRAGGSLESDFMPGEIVVVEAGGLLALGEEVPSLIVAEDGAVVDFTNAGDHVSGLFLYGPGTFIIGDPPTDGGFGAYQRPLTSIRPSYGIESFTVGVPLNISVSGQGSVSKSPELDYIPLYSNIQLTAIPLPGGGFTGWSGDIISTANPLDVRVENEPLNITANFLDGFTLTVFPIPGIELDITPDKALYDQDETVTLSASPLAGYAFDGWALDAEGTGPIELTMDRSKTVLPLVRRLDYQHEPRLVSAATTSLPEGESSDLTGSGLASVDSAELLQFSRRYAADVIPESDTALRFTMPAVLSGTRPHWLWLESPAGSTVALGDTFTEVTGVQDTLFESQRVTVVRSGAILKGSVMADIVYVEFGALFILDETSQVTWIIAEDGAVIDLSRRITPLHARFYHGPGTLIRGEMPRSLGDGWIQEMRAPIGASFAVGPFQVGYPLNLTIEGPGSVTVDPDKDWYEFHEDVTLTANPDIDAHFIRWIGSVSGRNTSITIPVRGDMLQIARFSTAPDYFSTWRLIHFNTEELADPTISGFDADPDGDLLSNSTEYAFGTDPRIADEEFRAEISQQIIDEQTAYFLTYNRPRNALDVEYRVVVSTDMRNWHYNGDGSEKVYSVETSVEPLNADLEKITLRLYPEGNAPSLFFTRISAALFDGQ